MATFSERMGYKSPRSQIQHETLDQPTKNRLWNIISGAFFGLITTPNPRFQILKECGLAYLLFKDLWDEFFKYPLDSLPYDSPRALARLREWYFEASWNDVLDIIEFMANHYDPPGRSSDQRRSTEFIAACNRVLEEEVTAYRFVGRIIVDIHTQQDLEEITEALALPDKFAPVRTHLNTALQLYADRKNPDYRNSIKESISAVESLCKILVQSPTATLGQALKALEQRLDLHGALKASFGQLYGWTSDASGIRHAMMELPNVNAEDARFMLIACAAFVNYVVVKASKLGLIT